jgi:hypothetical protein
MGDEHTFDNGTDPVAIIQEYYSGVQQLMESRASQQLPWQIESAWDELAALNSRVFAAVPNLRA